MNTRPILVPTTNQECEPFANPPARVDGQSYKALLIGIRGTKTKSEEYPELKGPHKDVEKVKALLIDTFEYRDSDITVLIDDGNAGHVQPTRENILAAIGDLVKDAKPGDHFVFHYCGHSTQIKNRSNTEEDGMDECLVPADGVDKRIVDNELNKALVLPLPSGCQLVAVLDTCHSGSLLDLKHDKCNRVVVPWIWGGKRGSDEMRRGVLRRDARWVSRLTSSILPDRKTIPRSPTPSTRLLAHPSEINMNLMSHPSPLTEHPSSSDPHGCGPSGRSGSGPRRTITYRADTFSSLSAVEETEAKNDSSEGWLGRLSCVSSSFCRSTQEVDTDTPIGNDSVNVPSALPGTFWVLPEDARRCASPEAIFACTGWCRESHDSATETEPSSGGVKAHVISLASCQDSQVTYEDGQGNSMTSAFVETLRRNPNQSLRDVLIHVSHTTYTKAVKRHEKAKDYKKAYQKYVDEMKPWVLRNGVKLANPNTVDTRDFQNPELSSARPLNMDLRFRM
ncbi:peptidase C14, caspase domain-containing protein [Mycena albidolilacea]|uniref:Peptidase C14, caspase domain-containing protein n=1 Tax=Mycena albidolilacea TaxID=1033008 RepID=A0AAD6Z6J4_9AGAR|nr:peptidase C14, caspase domain-containing protein [Mycena albidolilacea]